MITNPHENEPPMSSSQKIAIGVNVGLLFSIVVSVIMLLPFPLPFVDRFQMRLISGMGVFCFLNLSFWLAGWPGSALGITLLGITLVFTALIGQQLGLVGGIISFLAGVMAILLIMSDWPLLKDGEWVSRGHLCVYIGFVANLVFAALGVILWITFGGATVYGF
jgi:hypothetical protein